MSSNHTCSSASSTRCITWTLMLEWKNSDWCTWRYLELVCVLSYSAYHSFQADKTNRAHCGFPEGAFSFYAERLVKKGFKVMRVEQMLTALQVKGQFYSHPLGTRACRVPILCVLPEKKVKMPRENVRIYTQETKKSDIKAIFSVCLFVVQLRWIIIWQWRIVIATIIFLHGHGSHQHSFFRLWNLTNDGTMITFLFLLMQIGCTLPWLDIVRGARDIAYNPEREWWHWYLDVVDYQDCSYFQFLIAEKKA